MDRREILNELQQIVALTDGKSVSTTVAYCPEASQRARGLIQEIERCWPWPMIFQPVPFVSDQCAKRHHADCPLDKASPRICRCACHCRPDGPQQRAESGPPAEHHIDTPDELLELLAGISSDPQIERLSLAQKASTMALLYVAKEIKQIAENAKCLLMNAGFIAETLADRNLKDKSKQEPRSDAVLIYWRNPATGAEGHGTEPISRQTAEDLVNHMKGDGRVYLIAPAVQPPASPQGPS